MSGIEGRPALGAEGERELRTASPSLRRTSPQEAEVVLADVRAIPECRAGLSLACEFNAHQSPSENQPRLTSPSIAVSACDLGRVIAKSNQWTTL